MSYRMIEVVPFIACPEEGATVPACVKMIYRFENLYDSLPAPVFRCLIDPLKQRPPHLLP